MSWMIQLYDVYQHNSHRVGVFEEKRNQRNTLLPTSHMYQSAQIQINITPDGNFLNAKVINNERTIVPMTLDSANRSGKTIRPHYLHDKLFYVAGDYLDYGGEEKRGDYFKIYYKQLEEWANHHNSPKEVKAIFKYISQKSVLRDLIAEGILPLDEKGKIILKMSGQDRPEIYKVVSGNNVLEAFVRFNVIKENSVPVWENQTLFNSFIEFIKDSLNTKQGLCYVTGKNHEFLTNQHGSRIRNAADLSKLISSNDDKGFTFRGRFRSAEEAVQIGYDVSQKAHHALRWLIQRQGTYVDSRYFVAFGIEHAEVPEPFSDGLEFLSNEIIELSKNKVLTEEIVAKEIIKAMQGYKAEFDIKKLENIVVMAVDAATSGRLAIVYFQQFHPEFYINSLIKWHQSCRWLQIAHDNKTKKIVQYVGTPSTFKIAEAVYGSDADSRIKKDLYTRLLPSILENRKLPNDIIKTIFYRVTNPFSFKGKSQAIDYKKWNESLNIACALINKQFESEGYKLSVQEENNDRDYLFGRLLGVAEVMERKILKDRNESRATNATRLFNTFSQRPARTWQVIRKQLNPYFIRLGEQANFYSILIQKIESKISIEYMNDKPLGPVFLLGYSSQVQDLYTKKEEITNDSVRK